MADGYGGLRPPFSFCRSATERADARRTVKFPEIALLLRSSDTTSWASIVPPPFPTVPRQFPDSSQIRPRQFRLGSNFYLRPALLFDYVPKIT